MLKRINLPDQIYFVTSKAYQSKTIFNEAKNCQLFCKILKDCKIKYKFKLFGFVIIPNHIHLLLMPNDKMNISEVIHRIKGNFAYQYLMARNHKGSATRRDDRWLDKNNPLFRVADPLWVEGTKRQRLRIRPIWQKSFYDHAIRNDLDFIEKLNYIHGNPIKHGLTDNLDNYPWSSYHHYNTQNSQYNSLIEIDNIEL